MNKRYVVIFTRSGYSSGEYNIEVTNSVVFDSLEDARGSLSATMDVWDKDTRNFRAERVSDNRVDVFDGSIRVWSYSIFEEVN